MLSVSLTCEDVGGSGCANTYYSVDGSTPSLVYAGPLTIAEGNTSLRFFSVDNDGQIEIENVIDYTVDLTPPSVTVVAPLDSATEVATDSQVVVTFSEEIDVSTLTHGSITLDNSVGGTITYDPTSNTATYVPGALLKCNTTYNGSVTGIADPAGNVITGSFNWSFATTSDCDAPLTTASPDGGVIRGVGVDVTLTCTDVGTATSTGCARIVYTTDGSTPSFEPVNGTVVSGNTAGPITLGTGETILQYAAEDNAGNDEVIRSSRYAVSDNGYLYVAGENGLSRGNGPVPNSFITMRGGIGSGRVFRDVINNRLYSVTSGNLYVSDDDGMSWQEQCCDSFSVYDVYAVGSQIWLGTSNGLLISRDGLRTYMLRTVTDGLADNAVTQVYVIDNQVYVRTSTNSIGVSDDYGTTFSNYIFGDYGAYALFIDGDNIYVGGSDGLHISTDGGATFAPPKTTIDGLGSNTVVDIHAGNGNIYLATTAGVSVSTDGGNSFNNYTITGGSVDAIYVDGTTLYASAYNSYNSTGGVTIAQVQVDGTLTLAAFKDKGSGLRYNEIYEIEGGPGGEVYFSSAGGLSVSYDGGNSFVNNGLGGLQLFGVYANGSNVYVASKYGFSISTDGGNRFVTRTEYDGLGDNYTSNVIEHAGNIYVGTVAGLSVSSDGITFSNKSAADGIGSVYTPSIKDLSSDGTNLYIATDAGLSMPANTGPTEYKTLTTADGLASNSVTGVHVDNGIVYVATNGSGLNISSDNGATWLHRTSSDGLVSNTLYDVYAAGNYVHTGGTGSVSISTDGGVSFTKNPALSGATSYVSGHDNYVYVADFGDLKISSDNGMSFVLRDTSYGLPATRYIWDTHYTP